MTLLAVAVGVAAPVPKNLKPTDATALPGTWEVTAATYGGDTYDSAVGTRWTLTGDGSAVRDRPTQGRSTAKYKIDATADPKTFDWDTAEGHQFLGVYELDGDRFTVCLRQDKGGRPGKLTDTTGAYVFEFKRVKEKP